MPLFLTSRGLESEKIENAFKQLLPQKKNNKVYLITTASQEYKELNRNTQTLASKLNELNLASEFIDVEFEDSSVLRNADIIILCGGNPYYLLFHLKKSGADIILREKSRDGCLIFGISAGALVLQSDIEIIDIITPQMNTINLTDKRGLKLINKIVIPHYDRFVENGIIKLKEIENYESRTNKKVIGLGEDEGLVYFGNKIERVGSK